jgi:hypothetical protein
MPANDLEGTAIRTLLVSIFLAAVATMAGLAMSAPLAAQNPVPPPPPVRMDSVPLVAPPLQDQDAEPEGVSPGGAFLRGVLVPGWGHAAIGSHSRGGVYAAAQAGTAFMLVSTRTRIHAARRAVAARETAVLDRLAAEGVTDPAELFEALEADEALASARRLDETRQQQFQDWTALGIFLVFLSGADAFVSAHLQGFPAPVEMQFRPLPQGRVDVGARVLLPF